PYPKKGFYSEGIKLSCPEHENHSLSYEDVDIIEEINPTELKWYFELLEFLYNGCNDITSTLYNPIDANCYDIDSVISTIESKCSNAWNCPESGSCSCGEVDCTICENLYCYCGGTDCSSCTIKDAQADACAILFLEAGEDIPDECIPSIDYPTWPVDMLPVMENKCLEILEEEKTKDIEDQDDMPYECALVAIWKNDVEIYSDDYSESVGGGTVTLDEGKIGVLPDSFIGCNPPEIPSFPKIPLSDLNKEFSDIITPDFNFCPLIQVKLPDVTIEDLEFPDIELCNLQDCQDLLDYFPKFIDDLPALGRFSLEIPTIEIDPIEIDMIGDIEISPWEDRSLEFHMPQMPNLNPISLSEFIYEIPEIEIPKPELTFSFEELDADWLSIAIGWILNKIMADLPSGCITFEVTIGCLSIIFEDYHISWADFPEIPEIPACVTAQEFCRDSKEKLEEVIEVTNDIVDGIQSTIQDVLQIPGDAINDITNLVNEKVQEKEDEINDIIEGLIEDGEELIEIVDIDDIEIDISLTDIIDEIPEEITIPWEDLGIDPKIILLDPIEIEILPIPLSDMNVEVELVIHIPFVQVMEPFSAGLGGSVCESDTDSLFVFQDFFDEEFDTKLELQVEDIINIIKN
ncbi:MAG: hypothetical protein U9P61_01920, partial [Patescibacteria group bacterium]|nr:hypothetical protein [Patescibacteria group bacterium]